MIRKLITVAPAALLISFLMVCGDVRADEGTSDPNFDYLPPDDVTFFEQMRSYVTDLFLVPSHSGSYATAKRRLYRRIKDSQTFYCDCKTNLANRTFEKSSCGYVPRNDNERARRLEAEHILPASWIAKFHTGKSCWVADDECGTPRECCLTNDERFKKAHNDLVNLFPSIGELNADRSNLIYSMIDGEDRNYGSCDFEVDSDARVTEPKVNVRGDIARVYFYMRDTYGLKYPEELMERLVAWDKADPISEEERSRNQRIQEAQGSSNPLLVE